MVGLIVIDEKNANGTAFADAFKSHNRAVPAAK
jgi:hypothetical protein